MARVAATPSTVLLTGESGTGKEVMARALHAAGSRRDGPFVAVNCAAIPEHLLESELFGHEEGAFTGAVRRRTGRFERADGGTLFLDEIGDMSLVLQAKILRVLEERVVERVGGEATVPVDVRVVAATNQELADRMEEGEFREDLYYRLAVVELHLPPLRQRGRDIRTLALHFAGIFARRYERPVRAVTEAALQRLERYPWPGNVRELRNVMDRAVLLASGEVIGSGALRLGAGAPRSSPRGARPGEGGYPPTLSLAEVEASHIRRVLTAEDGHMGRTAEVLGIHRNTLTRKVQEYGIQLPGSDEGAG
jgi:two-component system response regulator HydG